MAKLNASLSRSSRPGSRYPALAHDEAAMAVAVGAEEQLLELLDDGLVRDIDAEIVRDSLGKRPIVVPAALVLVLLDQTRAGSACR